jgi:integrase
MIVTLTPAFIATQLIVPAGLKKMEFRDSVVRGLLIEARSTPDSVPTWCLRQKVAGKNYFDFLAPLPELTVAQARKLATQKKGERLASAKQAPEQKPAVGEMSLDAFWTDHYLPHAKIHKRSWVRDEQLYRIRIKPRFGNCKLSEITRYAVQQFQDDLSKEKLSPSSIDHHARLLKRMLGLSVSWDLLDRNPLKGFQLLNVDNQIEHYLKEDELQRLLEVLRTHENRPVCLLLMFLLSTGARSNEARQALWSQIDVENAVWRIPAANSKSKRTRAVPLNDSALWVLEQIGTRDVGGVVFANPETGAAYTPVTHAWYRIRKLAGVPHLRIHDLRHTFASLLVSGGRSLFEVQSILGHSDPKVTMRYAHLSTKALQAAANTASVLLPKATPPAAPAGQEAVAEAAPTAAILPFPRAA